MKAIVPCAKTVVILVLLSGILFTSSPRAAGQGAQTNPDHDFVETYRQAQEEIRRQQEELRSVQSYLWTLEGNELAARVAWSFDHPFIGAINTHNLVTVPEVSVTENNNFNAYGANFKVPNGSYSGNEIISLYELELVPIGPIRREIISYAGLGWNFEPGNLLVREIITISARGFTDPVTNVQSIDCGSIIRYRLVGPNGVIYFQKRGIEVLCNFTVNGTSDPFVCSGYSSSCPTPTEFWSNSGQIMLDVSNPSSPILRYPDGTVETMARPNGGFTSPFHAQHAGMFDPNSASSWRGASFWATSKVQDRNGNQTTYNYDNQTGWLASIVDPQGRTTTYGRDNAHGSPRITSIAKDGPGGTRLTWQMTYSNFSFNPSESFPEVLCAQEGQFGACPAQSFTTLTQLTIPDQRTYTFSYGPWGNLTRVSTPDGAVQEFEYGGSATNAFIPPGWNFPGLPLHRRRVTAKTIYPQGLGGPGFTTRTRHANEETIGTGVNCAKIQWIRDTLPDGTIKRTGICSFGGLTALGRAIAEETLRDGVLIEATYFGNTGTFGDISPIGTMFLAWETASGFLGQGIPNTPVDIRPVSVVHFRDGVHWRETFGYDSSDIPADGGVRTYGNVTLKSVLDLNGFVRATTESTFFQPQPYRNKNLIRLPETVTIVAPDGGILGRTDYTYDAFSTLASGAPNLNTIGNVRGNVSTQTAYRDAQNATGGITTEMRYFDTGHVQKVFDPLRRNPVTSTYTFGLCANTPLVTNTNTNILGHQTSTVSDCFTGLTLKATDPNNQSTYTQYDNLGRLVETAVPGDTLTPIPGFIRDPGAHLNSGSVVGNDGQGPTTWMEYRALGVINEQRTVAHSKDGTSNGRYSKTFFDGLGRTIQARAEVDPFTAGGNTENVATTEYDLMGRVSKAYVPCFSSPSNSVTSSCTSLATTTQYDPLGRPKSIQPPGLPATSSTYGSSGGLFLTTVTDAKTNQTLTLTDALGRTVQVSRQSDTCVGNWCVTMMDYDAAGRLLQTTDPGSNRMSFIYDGLGRKVQMTDPDMGTWSYAYDDNGNLSQQTDAKGQIIVMTYDPLNRITRKDLPPNNSAAGAEDTTYFYDGEGPAP